MESQQLSQTQNAVVVKLATEERGVKRLKNAPRNFSELLGVVREQTKRSDTEMIKISYVDDAGDEVAVSDDEDLAAAYDWATTQTNRNVKLSVKDNKRRRSDSFKKEVKEVVTKFEDMNLKESKNPQSEESNSSSSEDEKKGGIMHQAIGIPTTDQKDRREKKALRKFIKQSMKQHSKELIQSIIKDKAGDVEDPQIEETKASDPLRESVHERVECDGCGIAPIVGVRYKNLVLKNYDLCAKCEANRPDKVKDHAFIKINDPS
jgi:hypothetical protein